MFRFRNLLSAAAALAVAAVVGSPTLARADFEIRISDGTHTVIVQDNGTGDGDPTTGSIVVTTATLTAGGITGWSQINVTTSYSNKLSTDGFAMLEVGTSARANASGTLTSLTIDVSDTGFTSPPNSPSFTMTSNVVSTSVPGSETVQGFYDASNGGNNQYSIPGQASTTQQTVTNGVSPSNPATTIITPGISPFALDYREVLTATAHSQFFSTDNELTVVSPEPSSMALVACGASCAFGYMWKRRKKAVVAA